MLKHHRNLLRGLTASLAASLILATGVLGAVQCRELKYLEARLQQASFLANAFSEEERASFPAALLEGEHFCESFLGVEDNAVSGKSREEKQHASHPECVFCSLGGFAALAVTPTSLDVPPSVFILLSLAHQEILPESIIRTLQAPRAPPQA